MKTILTVLGILGVAGQYCRAQLKVDTAYIKQYDDKRTFNVFLGRRSLELNGAGKIIKPNSPLNIGLGYSVKNTVINLEAVITGIRLASKEKYGKSSVFDLQMHNYGRRLLIDLFYQRYHGFYYQNMSTREITHYPDLGIRRMGGEATYLFNNKQLSLKAAFQEKQRQVKSAGSFVLGGGAYYTRLNNIAETGLAQKDNLDNFQVGVGAGYAYSWVINKHWLLSGMATLGVNAINEWNEFKHLRLKAYPRAFARGAAGYSRSDWGLYFSFLVHNDVVYNQLHERLTLTTINNQLSYIRHFNYFFRKKKEQEVID